MPPTTTVQAISDQSCACQSSINKQTIQWNFAEILDPSLLKFIIFNGPYLHVCVHAKKPIYHCTHALLILAYFYYKLEF